MAGPDPATTEWVPVWSPVIAGPSGPPGPPGAGAGGAHAPTHLPGGADPIPNNALTNVGNVFVPKQIFQAVNPSIELQSVIPAVILNETAAVVDKRKWRIINYQEKLTLDCLNDAENAVVDSAFTFDRQGAIRSNPWAPATYPRLQLNQPYLPADQRLFEVVAVGGNLTFQAVDDAITMAQGYVHMNRAGSLSATGNITAAGVIEGTHVYTALRAKGSPHAGILLDTYTDPADKRKWRIINYQQNLKIDCINDAENANVDGSVTISRAGSITATGDIAAGGRIDAVTLVASPTLYVNTINEYGLGYVNVTSGLGVNGNITVGTTLNVAGATTLSSTLNVTGVTTLGTLITGNIGATDVSSSGWSRSVTGAGFIFDHTGARGLLRDGASALYLANDVGSTELRFASAIHFSIKAVPAFGVNGCHTSHLLPIADVTYYLGYQTGTTPNYRWLGGAYLNAPVLGSDGRDKEILGEEPLGLHFINLLKPVAYRWLVDKRDETRPGPKRRTKHGFVAQDLETTLNTLGVEFDGLETPETPEGNYGLAYTELLAPMVKAMQEMSAKIDELTAKIQALEAKKDET